MAKMMAVRVTKPGAALSVVETDIIDPKPGQVRVKVQACGICHSDAFVKSGAFPGLQLPRTPGHEIAGVIDAVGSGVDQWRVGERVGVGWHGGHCFVCNACRRGHFINCEKAQVTGISYDGGFAEYAVVRAEAVARIPDGLSPEDAGPLLCAGITTYNALRNSGVRPGDTVAVQGIGGLGHLGIQYAAQMGLRTVALSSGSSKEALARELGAHEYIDTSKTGASEGLQRLGGADLVLATAPNADAIASTLGGLKPRGKLLIVAAPGEPFPVSAFALLTGKTIAGWPSGTAMDSQDAMSFATLTGVRPRTEVFALEKADEALSRVLENKVRFRAVLRP